MTEATRGSTEEQAFMDGTSRVDSLLARPDLAQSVRGRRAELREANRTHAMGLATLRKAAELTQTELAAQLGINQSAVAKIERRPDMLLSTLRSYIEATGSHLRIVVEFPGGRQADVDLGSFGE